MTKFKQACFAHDLSKKFHTFYTQVIFGCTWHSLNKFGSALVGTKILRSTILKQACFVLTYRKCWDITSHFTFHVAYPYIPIGLEPS